MLVPGLKLSSGMTAGLSIISGVGPPQAHSLMSPIRTVEAEKDDITTYILTNSMMVKKVTS